MAQCLRIQALVLRGSRDFSSVAEYELFLKRLFEQLNSGRKERLAEEMEALRPLLERNFDSAKRVRVRVSSGSLHELVQRECEKRANSAKRNDR